MEHVDIRINNASRFDEVVHKGLPEGRDLEMVSKHGVTENGNAAVAITFTVEVDGEQHRAQAVTTLAALVLAARALEQAEASWVPPGDD